MIRVDNEAPRSRHPVDGLPARNGQPVRAAWTQYQL